MATSPESQPVSGPDNQPTIAFTLPTPETVGMQQGANGSDHGLRSGGPSIPGYEVLGELGRGGMGVVYKARQVKLQRLVAIKTILTGAHAGPDERQRFQIEIETIARLQHPHFVQIFEVGEIEGRPYCVLEFVEGGSLAGQLTGKPLPVRWSTEIVATLARAIEEAHRQDIIHRDLKPANVLLARREEDEQTILVPKITDFGLAKRLDENRSHTQTGMIVGTPAYMAPEQAAARSQDIGPATDVYALGAILYEMLSGRPPFTAETTLETIQQVIDREPLPPRLLAPAVDRDLETIVLKCLEKEPSRRYISAAELADDLERYLANEPILARSINLLERLQRELVHSQHETHLRPWGKGLMLLAGLIFLAHLGTSLLLLAGFSDLISFWGPRSLMLLLIAPLLWRYRPSASLWPTNAIERVIWAIWIGYLLTFFSLYQVMRLQEHSHLEVYGAASAVSGMAWFVMGGLVWGGCYLIGGAFLVLAPLMALLAGSLWSSFVFGLQWSVALLILGGRYWRMGMNTATPVRPGANGRTGGGSPTGQG